MAEQPAGQSAGPSVDRQGAPVIDPTENVLALVAAQVKRADDLMLAFEKLIGEKNQRQDDLRNMESKHIREVADLTRSYEAQLRDKETQRLDAIRQVDVGAVGKASEVQATVATTLQAQVERTAAAAAATLNTTVEPILAAVAELRRYQFEQQGQRAQQQESRVDARTGTQNNQWLIGVVIGVAIFAADFIAKKV